MSLSSWAWFHVENNNARIFSIIFRLPKNAYVFRREIATVTMLVKDHNDLEAHWFICNLWIKYVAN